MSNSMLAAVIADTHLPRGGRRLPEACVELMLGADLLLHAGDFTTEAAFEEFRTLGPPLVAVHGNVDVPPLQRALPERQVVEVEGVLIGMTHDAGPRKGRLERLRRAFPDTAAVVFGHSHLPLLESSDVFQIFNPGSPTERRRAPVHTMGLARIGAGRVEFEFVEL
jgi:uncharacterized protein